MLVIRMQRTGRSGHAQFRVVVQDSRRTPTSGKIVAQLGHFNPHTKETKLDKEKASFFLEHGAQPSPRVVRLLKAEKVVLPGWVKEPAAAKRETRNPEKRRSTAPAEPAPAAEETSASAAEAVSEEAPVSEPEVTATEATAEEPTADEATQKPEESAPAKG